MIQTAEEPGVEVRLCNVYKTFRMGEVDVPVLRGVDLAVRRGELTVVHGPSGSGKTTLLNLIGGIDTPTEGEVWFEGQDLAAQTDRQRTRYRRRCVGFVFQFYNLVPTLTALENVEVSTEIAEGAMDASEALELVGLADRQAHFPAQLSGGEQQRVSIARALAKRPRLMLCDEPTGALDMETGRRVLGLLTRLNEDLGVTTMIITHASLIGRLAHRVVHLGSGRILEERANEARARAEELIW